MKDQSKATQQTSRGFRSSQREDYLERYYFGVPRKTEMPAYENEREDDDFNFHSNAQVEKMDIGEERDRDMFKESMNNASIDTETFFNPS